MIKKIIPLILLPKTLVLQFLYRLAPSYRRDTVIWNLLELLLVRLFPLFIFVSRIKYVSNHLPRLLEYILKHLSDRIKPIWWFYPCTSTPPGLYYSFFGLQLIILLTCTSKAWAILQRVFIVGFPSPLSSLDKSACVMFAFLASSCCDIRLRFLCVHTLFQINRDVTSNV